MLIAPVISAAGVIQAGSAVRTAAASHTTPTMMWLLPATRYGGAGGSSPYACLIQTERAKTSNDAKRIYAEVITVSLWLLAALGRGGLVLSNARRLETDLQTLARKLREMITPDKHAPTTCLTQTLHADICVA